MNKYEIVSTELEKITPTNVAQVGDDILKVLDNSEKLADKLYGDERQIHLNKINNLKEELSNIQQIINDGEVSKEEKKEFINKADVLYKKIDIEYNDLLKLLKKKKIVIGTMIGVQIAWPIILQTVGIVLKIKAQSNSYPKITKTF